MAGGRWWWVTDRYGIWRQLGYRVCLVGIGNDIRARDYGREGKSKERREKGKKGTQ